MKFQCPLNFSSKKISVFLLIVVNLKYIRVILLPIFATVNEYVTALNYYTLLNVE